MSRITINPKVMTGKPCVRDTRIPVSIILKLLANGQSWDEIIDDYPDLSNEDIIACLEFAADNVSFTTLRIES